LHPLLPLGFCFCQESIYSVSFSLLAAGHKPRKGRTSPLFSAFPLVLPPSHSEKRPSYTPPRPGHPLVLFFFWRTEPLSLFFPNPPRRGLQRALPELQFFFDLFKQLRALSWFGRELALCFLPPPSLVALLAVLLACRRLKPPPPPPFAQPSPIRDCLPGPPLWSISWVPPLRGKTF